MTLFFPLSYNWKYLSKNVSSRKSSSRMREDDSNMNNMPEDQPMKHSPSDSKLH